MKKITWIIGTQKPSGDIVQDSCIHYRVPKMVILNGTYLEEGVNYTYSPDFNGATYSDIYGYLDFTLSGGLSNTQSLTIIF